MLCFELKLSNTKTCIRHHIKMYYIVTTDHSHFTAIPGIVGSVYETVPYKFQFTVSPEVFGSFSVGVVPALSARACVWCVCVCA